MFRFMHATVAVVCVILNAANALAADAIAHVEQRGEGPIPMILIPGSPCDWTVWDEFMNRNEERYTMYALTLAGFAGTDPLPTPEESGDSYTPWLDAAVDAIAELIEEKELADVVVVGHSLGGHLALRLGVEHPRAAAKLIDIDGVPTSEFGGAGLSPAARSAEVESKLGPQFRKMNDEDAALLFDMTASTMVTDKDRAKELAEHFKKTETRVAMEYLMQGMKSDVQAKLKDLAAPTLVIVATGQANGDPAGMQRIRDYWTRWTEGADAITIQWFDDSKHFVMDDQPEKLDQAIEEFVTASDEADESDAADTNAQESEKKPDASVKPID